MRYRKLHALISRPFQILTTGLVLLGVIAAVDGVIIAVAESLTLRQKARVVELPTKIQEDLKKQQRLERSTIEFQEDGTIHLLFRPVQPGILSYEDFRPMSQSRPAAILQVYDVNDDLLWEGRAEEIPYQYLGWSQDTYAYDSGIYDRTSPFDVRRLRGMQALVPELSATLEIKVEREDGRLELWQYDPVRDFLAAFEARGAKIGYISSSGFTVSKSETRPFGKFGSLCDFTEYMPFRPAVLWQTDKRLYQIDLQTRQVDVLFESCEADIDRFSIRRCTHRPVATSAPYLRFFDENCRSLIDCITQDKSHHLILMEPLEHLTIALPDEWAAWQEIKVEVTATKQGIFLRRAWTQTRPAPDRRNRKQLKAWTDELRSTPLCLWDELYRVNEDGSLQLLSSFSRTRATGVTVEAPAPLPVYVQNVQRMFSPPLYALAWHKLEDKISDEISEPSTFLSAIGAVIIRELHPDKIVPNLSLSASMVFVALWHGWARRTGWAKLVLWLVLVGAFNLAGLLTYLALNHRAVIKCGVCGKKRGLESFNCIRCGSPLPVPQRRPTDLIEIDKR